MIRSALLRNIPRRFASSGHTETKATTKITAEGVKTQVVETITYAKQTWSNMSPLARRLTYGYVGCMVVDNVYGTYQGGKEGLEQFRLDQSKSRSRGNLDPDCPYRFRNCAGSVRTAETDWQAAYYGCRRDMFSRFLASTIWPIGIFSKIMPSLVIALNPPPPPK